jgi:mannitol/fructose-specific phosphotransferase system IIA component (Ntr-type)
VDFDSLDGRPTTLLVVLVSPADDPSQHVTWLAHVARVLADKPTRRQLLEATSAEQILEVLAEREKTFESAAAAIAKGTR